MTADVVIAHSSDLHLGDVHVGSISRLHAVVGAAERAGADVLVLAGDTFDNNRVSDELVDEASQALHKAALTTVVLPGNHDCLEAGSVWTRGHFERSDKVFVLGREGTGETVCFPRWRLEVCGRAHRDQRDLEPLGSWGPRPLGIRRVVVAHGHWVQGIYDAHRAFRFHTADVALLDASYVALGHWDILTPIEGSPVPAYYSGQPHRVGTVNIVTLEDASVLISQASLDS